MRTDELLNFAQENGMVDLAQIRAEYVMDKYLKQHTYKIWQGTNGRWYTYLPDDEGGRKQVSKLKKEDVDKAIISYYRSQAENPTVDELFNIWADKKLRQGDICESTYSRYHDDYKAFFQTFGKRKIKHITEMDIEDFLKDTVADYNLPLKRYSGIRTLLYGIFKMAKKMGFISYRITDVVQEIDFSRNSFRKVYKEDEEQVFLDFEERKITKYLMENQDIINLGILLMFKTGMRVGELTSLQHADIQGNRVHVCKTETRYWRDGKYTVGVKDQPKTDAGNRKIIIKDEHLWILERIKMLNPNGEYLFEVNGKRCTNQAVRLRLYKVCKKNGIKRKSPHKARKTYGSKLYDSRIPESLICRQMGHTDISCLKKYYYFNLMDDEYNIQQINSVKAL